MTLSVSFRRAASEEFIEAAARYEAQRPGLGAEFIAEIERCVVRAADRPELYALIHNGMRRVTAKRFPYSLYFRSEEQRVVILAVFHGSRDPANWQRRA